MRRHDGSLSLNNKKASEADAASGAAARGAAAGAAKWGICCLLMGGAGYVLSPIYRGLTIQFKVFLQMSGMTLGGMIEADRRLRTFEAGIRREKRLKRDERAWKTFEEEFSATEEVPCSSANIGPGFDVIGLALSIWLELQVHISDDPSPVAPLNCQVTYSGVGEAEVSLDPERNLITRTALYVLRCHGQHDFPRTTRLHITNAIPLGRGLGSSGAAVVAGVLLADAVGNLQLPRPRVLDYCLMIERHPDNVAAALYGGFVGTYLADLSAEATSRKEIPLSEVLPEPAGGLDTGLRPPSPPVGISHYRKFRWAPEIKAVAIIPDFEVSTARARGVLPPSYGRQDVVFNLQRVALLVPALGQSPPDADMIYEAMQDRVHQPYRQTLIPGLADILGSLTPKSHPGLLGICLSGAGPTILALATHDFDAIARVIVEKFAQEGITCDWRLLEPAHDGATVERS